jgi:hypothetical protein
MGRDVLVSRMTQSPAVRWDVVREYYRGLAGSLIFGNASLRWAIVAATTALYLGSLQSSVLGSIMGASNSPPLFTCPSCKALYQCVKIEAGPETADNEIRCQICSGPLVGREGKFVLKYYL